MAKPKRNPTLYSLWEFGSIQGIPKAVIFGMEAWLGNPEPRSLQEWNRALQQFHSRNI